MPTSVSIAFNQSPDPLKAVAQAAVQVKNQLDSANTDLVIVFASPEFAQDEVLAIISRTLRPKRLIGSSTGGLILANGVASRGITIAGINSDDMDFGISALNDVASQDMHSNGFNLARKASQDMGGSPHKEVFISLSEGIEQNSSQFIRGVREALGLVFPVLGGVSSDDFKNKNLFQFFQDKVLRRSAVGLILGGSARLAIGCRHDFKPLGKPRTITRVEGPLIRTIDDKPAIEIYKHFLGPDANSIKDAPLNSYAAPYPLGVYLREPGQYLLRNIIDILDDGSILCHEGITTGCEVHLMISNNESCLASATLAAKLAKGSLTERQPKLVLVFESLARQKILGRDAVREIQAIRNVLGQAVPLIGMCTYGEIGPFGTLNNIKNIYLHNDSIMIAAIS